MRGLAKPAYTLLVERAVILLGRVSSGLWCGSTSALRTPSMMVRLAACVLAAVYFVVWQAPAAGTFHDDAVYMVTAKSIAEGKGYRVLSLPQEVPQTKYPVLFPLLLSAVWKWFPEFPANASYLKLIALISALVWFALVFRLLKQEGATDRVAAIVTLLTASCGWVVYLSTAVLSETLFAMLTTASLLFLSRAENDDSPLWVTAIAAVFAALAFHTRSIGLALLVAGPVVFLLRRKWLPAVVFAFTTVLLCSPWLLWIAVHRDAAAVDGYASMANYQSWNVIGGFTWIEKIHIVGLNLLTALAAPASLAGFPTGALLLVPAVLIGLGIIAGMRSAGMQSLTIFLAAYVGVTLLWAWAPVRLLVPVLPLFYWFGYKLLARRPRVLMAVCSLLLLASVNGAVKPVRQALALGDAQPGLTEEDSWPRMQSLLEWVKHNTPQDAVLAGNLDPLYYLYTGRKAIRGFQANPYPLIYSPAAEPIGSPGQILAQLEAQSVSYWVFSPNSAFREGMHLRTIQKESLASRPERVQRLHAGQTETHDILQLRNTRTSPASAFLR